MTGPRVFIDMDGVLFDFVTATSRAHNRPSPYLAARNYGHWDMAKLWNITPEAFWAPLNYEGFWSNMEPLPYARTLVETCLKYTDNICVLSSPSESKYCVPEKRASIKKYFPEFGKNILFGASKQFIAGPNKILVDDYDVNVDKWRGAGGTATLWPQPWNSGHQDAGNKAAVLRNLEIYLASLRQS